MLTTLPNPTEPRLKLAFIDCWKQPGLHLPHTNSTRCFTVAVKDGYPLRICLAYTDLPARELQHVIYLLVEGPDGRKWMGNGRRSARGHPLRDDKNNVSVVRFDAPLAGHYRISVRAWTLLHGAQDYALVVTGDLESELTRA
jgi:hypothetical protein